MSYPNPILPGSNADPSIVKVGGDYYLVTSSFEYLPAIPVFHSTDLSNWTQIGAVVTHPDQTGLDATSPAAGVWAPTIRHRDGVFRVAVTIVGGRGCVVFASADPTGDWGQGTVIDAVGGIDPDLAWGDDGTAYITYSGLYMSGPLAGSHLGIQQVRVDLQTGLALEEPRTLWSGTGLKSPEGPHLYRRGEHWYLLVAEGGTERGHCVSVARSSSPEGPFESNPNNPILSHRSTARPIQNTGHGDLVETPDGGTVMVLLGMRPRGIIGGFSPLGRETFITGIEWHDDWPVAEPVELQSPTEPTVYSNDFTADTLENDWMSVRRSPTSVASLTERPGWLVLHGAELSGAEPTTDATAPALVCRRQQNHVVTVSTRVDATAGVGGLLLRYDDDHDVALELSGSTVTARARVAGIRQTWVGELKDTDAELVMEILPSQGTGILGPDRIVLSASSGGERIRLAEIDGRHLCAEAIGTGAGRMIGLYAAAGTVAFDWFRYHGADT